jgi:hypothetical protein
VSGAEIFLWAFTQNEMLYSREALPWPGNGGTTNFDASFSTSTPNGAAPATSTFAGEVFGRNGRQLPPGARVEAYVRDIRCGVGSVRRTGNFSGYVLAVVGPDSVPGCERGATLTFRIDGRLARDTRTNLATGGSSFDLTLR